MNERWAIRVGLVAMAAIGAGLRLWHATTVPLWLDEAYSAYAAAHGFAFLWRVVPLYETHPPFYYALVRLWTFVFGDGLVALRALGLAAGLATTLVLLATAREAGQLLGWEARRRRWLGFALFALGCVSIPLVEMAREVRPYPLMILVYALALLALLRIARRQAAGQPLAGAAFTGLLAAIELLLWLHNLGPLWATALGLALFVLLGRRATRADWAWAIGGLALAALLYLPAFLILLDQAPTWIRSTWVRFTFGAMWERLAVLYAVPGWQGIAAIVLAALGGVALWRTRGEAHRLLVALVLLALVPTLLSITLTLAVAPVFITRTLTPVAVPALLLLAIGAVAWWEDRRARWVALGAAMLLGTNLLAVDVQARGEGPPQNWYGAIDWLAGRWRPGDLILAYPNEGALPLRRALGDRGLAWPVRAVPSDVPSLDWPGDHPTGTRGVVVLPRPVLDRIAATPAIRDAPTLWLLRLGRETYDPGDAFLRTLHRDRYIVRHLTDGPIDIVGLRIRPAPAPVRNRR